MQKTGIRFLIKYLFLLPYFFIAASAFYYRSVLLSLAAVSLCVSGGYMYYQLFGRVVEKADLIKNSYSLSIPEQIEKNYIQYLCFMLEMVEHKVDVEYSEQLMRKQAEFDSMKSQINPHFLYNTLDSIRGYALKEKAPVAANMIEILSRIFRYTISQKAESIMIREELDMVRDYLAIQRYRLSNQVILNVRAFEHEKFLLDYQIPKLIIQPFIENAIKHGMKDNIQDFHIDITISAFGKKMIISVADDGKGMTNRQLVELNERLYSNEYGKSGLGVTSRKGSGIAIVNVNARIKLLYGEEYGVTAYSDQKIGSRFEIVLPYTQEQ